MGIPQVLNPLGADQWENADAAADAGLAITCELDGRSAVDIAAALSGILNDPQYRLGGRKGGRGDRGHARAGRSRRDHRSARRLGQSTRPPVADVAPDGSPVDLYRVLLFEADLARVQAFIPPDASILDLGSGPGRLSNPLAAAGHEVVAVDDSAEMLSHVTRASTVLVDVWQLDLGRQIDIVIALSHLINDRSPARRNRAAPPRTPPTHRRHRRDRRAALSTRLVAAAGITKDWAKLVCVSSTHSSFSDGGFSSGGRDPLGGQTWVQRFQAAIVDDAELNTLQAAADRLFGDRSTNTEAGCCSVPPGASISPY